MSRLSPQEVQRYYAQKLRDGYPPRTIRHYHTLLHRALEVAVTWELLERNPSDRVTLPAAGPSPDRCLDPEEVRRLLSLAQATEYHVPVHLALFSGLRKGEVPGLDGRDVDTDARTIQVRQALLYNSKMGYFYGEPKSRGSSRTVAIPQLTSLLQPEMAERAGPAAEIPGQVCAFRDGRLMKPTTLDKAFRRLVSAAGLEKVRFHDLRHTHASQLLDEGTPMHVVQAAAGAHHYHHHGRHLRPRPGRCRRSRQGGVWAGGGGGGKPE